MFDQDKPYRYEGIALRGNTYGSGLIEKKIDFKIDWPKLLLGRKSKLLYLAGPYSEPDPVLNTNAAIREAARIMQATRAKDGTYPVLVFVPHVMMAYHLVQPMSYEFWLDYSMEILRRCDAVVRLPGESSGADKEVAEARKMNIPVYDSVEEFLMSWMTEPVEE